MSHQESGHRSYRTLFRWTEHSVMADWLIRRGIVKTSTGAKALLLGSVIFNFAVAVAVFVRFYLMAVYRVMPAGDENDIGMIGDKAIAIHQLIQQHHWIFTDYMPQFSILEIFIINVVGAVLGTLWALWQPLLVIVAISAAVLIYRRRCQKQ